uniref:putative porin n=1 Tax=Algoriphagus sp. TaxID=1872435 RepID=UPI0040484F98
MNRKLLTLSVFVLLLVAHAAFGQRPIRPIPQGGGIGNPAGTKPVGRQLAEPLEDEEEQEGRRTLLDDSTKQVYGPKTTLFFYEQAIKRNSLVLYEVDTLLTNFHNYDPIAKSGWKYQDLGNIGSAAKPVYFGLPDQIGLSSGFDAYDLYFKDPSTRKFYDSKSPFTEMAAFFGGGHRNMLDLSFARNVNPRWNLGFDFSTQRVRKTLNPSQRDDHMVVQNGYAFHTNYRSENGRYWLLGSFSRMKHVVNEIGGIIPPAVDTTSIYFTYEDAKVWLQQSRARELRQEYHLYQEFKLGNGLQFYHVLDRKNQALVFESLLSSSDGLFFPKERLIDPDSTQNRNDFSEWRNELGIKGTVKQFYYNSFVKLRNGNSWSPQLADPARTFTEVYIGGELIGKLSDTWQLQADGEYLLPGNFRLHGLFISPWLDVDYTKALYKPSLFHQQYRGNHREWNNDFSDIGVDQIKGTVKVPLEKIQLRPSLTLTRINNYVFLGTEMKAQQAAGQAFLLMPALKASIPVGKKFRIDSELIYTKVSGESADVLRIPAWYNNTKVYFDGPLFDDNVYVQMGIDVRFQSTFFADAYQPSLQQFHLQNSFEVQGYPVLDLFLDFRINRTRVLFKYNHLNAGLMAQEGYFVTPDYTGYRSFLDLGISWYLFD